MADYGKLNFAVAFNPTTAFPLDARTLFYSYDDAVAAAATAKRAGSKDTVYYWGMRLTVVNEAAQTAKQYIIQPTGRLVGIVDSTSGSSGGSSISPEMIGDTLIIDQTSGLLDVNVATTVTKTGELPVSGSAVADYVEDVLEDSLGVIEDIVEDI